MSDPHPLKPKSGIWTILGVVLALALITAAGTAVLFWRMGAEVTDEARRMADSIAQEFNRTFNFIPEVRVDSILVIHASTPKLELLILERTAQVRHRWSHTWLHSTKTVEIEATFTAKAGFDLEEPFRIQIDPRTRNVGADFPPPKILSIGMSDVRILNDEDGLWNKLTAEDRQKAFRELEKKARDEFKDSNLLAETRIEAEKRIRSLLQEGSAKFSSPLD
jgi:hypothetical protein